MFSSLLRINVNIPICCPCCSKLALFKGAIDGDTSWYTHEWSLLKGWGLPKEEGDTTIACSCCWSMCPAPIFTSAPAVNPMEGGQEIESCNISMNIEQTEVMICFCSFRPSARCPFRSSCCVRLALCARLHNYTSHLSAIHLASYTPYQGLRRASLKLNSI